MYLHKNPRNICVAICFWFTKKIFILTRLINAHLQSRLDINFNKDTHRTVLYFLVCDQDKEKQKDFKNVMSFRGKIVSTCQLYKPLAEKHKFRKYSN